MPASIPNWVPEAARIVLANSTQFPLSEAGRALLFRLATDPTMKTEVWEKLPVEPAGKEGLVIRWAIFAFTQYHALVPRPGPKAKKGTWREWAKMLQENSQGATPESAARLAHMLHLELQELAPYSSAYWSQLWQGDRSITADKANDLVYRL